MVRNIVVAVSSLAVLIILFVVYTALVGEPTAERDLGRVGEALVPPGDANAPPLRVGGAVEVPAGGKIVFRRYDERSGRPRDMFVCEDWKPVPGSKNEIRVSGPAIDTLLPGGMIATISADDGQVAVDRVEQSQMRPKNGRLTGNVQIVIDRETKAGRTPPTERPQDLITFKMPELEFDLDIGELKSPDRVTVHAEEFEIAGAGLHLIWNQADNRIETLTIREGEEFVLYAAAGLFGMGAAEDLSPPADTQPTEQVPTTQLPRHPKSRRRPPRAYTCTLEGGLVAEQFRGPERIGGLTADRVELLFDIGAGADRMLRPKAATTAPVHLPREQRDRLVVHWQGALALSPAGMPAPGENRRRFEARGAPVTLTRGTGEVRCGRVVFHDDTQRVWLYPTAQGRVEFGLREDLTATAESVYIERSANLVKLIGDVELGSVRTSDTGTRRTSIRSRYWAELRVAAGTPGAAAPTDDPLMTGERLESATFVGDVVVDLGEQKLTAHRLDVGFRPGAAGQSLEEALDTANATGEVVLTSGDGTLKAAQLALAFALSPAQELYPREMDAVGAVHITRRKASVRGNRVRADLVPPDPNATEQPAFVMRELQILGEAELIEPEKNYAARGGSIEATFEGLNQLQQATVRGTADEFGLVYAQPFSVRGARIDLDAKALTLRVDGASWLAFKTERSLRGQRRKRARPIEVTSSKLLCVDGRKNTVRFVGDVVAQSDGERLQGDTLTLLLEDVPEPPPAPETPVQRIARQVRAALGAEEDQPSRDDLFIQSVESQSEKIRKEPVRLTADRALASSETFEPGEPEPVVQANISAPLLEVDIVQGQTVTTGLTQLLMLDRRRAKDAEQSDQMFGVPSALATSGPSQTAIACEGRMTYTLGPEGPDRRDTVVFEKLVRFARRTGEKMVAWEQMLPSGMDRTAVAALPSRSTTLDSDRLECWFTADESEAQAGLGDSPTRQALRLASLLATGNVYLYDLEGAREREVYAASVEFQREQGRLHMEGANGGDARVYFRDKERGQDAFHASPRVTINLRDGTISTDRIRGEMRRP